MASSPSRRKFAPEPIETSTRSSAKRTAAGTAVSNTPPRDESTASIKDCSSPTKKFKPEPVETTTRSRRKQEQGEPDQDIIKKSETPDKPRKKFAPEPVETSTRSRRGKAGKEEEPETPPDVVKKKKKFAPQPIEGSTTRRRRRATVDEDEEKHAQSDPGESPRLAPPRSVSPKKFSPELLETARGSYKRSLPVRPFSALPPHLRALAPGTASIPEGPSQSALDTLESKFSAAALAKRHHADRRHSYVAPDLPDVLSDESEQEESDVPSLSATPSASSDETVESRRNKSPHPVHDDLNVDHLSLEAHEKALREQAMAAYINENKHEPVNHFGIDDEEDDVPVRRGKLSGSAGIDVSTFRRDSAVELDWHMAEMRKHHAELDKLKQNLKNDTAGASRFSAAALAMRHDLAKKKEDGEQRGHGMKQMQDAASPPMLGGDIVFPRSISPKMTRLTPDQVPVPRKAGREPEEATESDCNLWGAKIEVSQGGNAGLWMGMCQKGDEETRPPPPAMRSGIMTPAVEGENPLEVGSAGKAHGKFGHGLGFAPLSPPQNTVDDFAESLDKKLNQQQEIEKEFSDGMVTQVYNYLSLGYPVLAWKFDMELAKISRISIEELRKDDERADAKGYVGAPEGEGISEQCAALDGKCARWTALKFYVQEWARQVPQMGDKEREDWGVRGRRGSWAF